MLVNPGHDSRVQPVQNSLISFLGRNAPLTPSNFLTLECHLSQRGQELKKKKKTESGSFIQLQCHWWKNLLWPSLLTAGAELPPFYQKNSTHTVQRWPSLARH